ncbi:MAG: histidinol dehydrogenase [Planctomycetota bacterium]|nr:histidinol dehydrogenase [Planctomycetota bacterium]
MKLRRLTIESASKATVRATDSSIQRDAVRIVDDVRARGEIALKEHARAASDWRVGTRLVFDRDAIEDAAQRVDDRDVALLSRTANRLRTFAAAQRRAVTDVCIPLAGGHAGQTVEPVERAGCYAASGKLPSAVLMTAVTARAAGVRNVWVAVSSPSPIVFAAAYVAGVDSLLAVGGPAAIGAFAFGAGVVPACNAIVGIGDARVAAAKQHVAGRVAIDVTDGANELCALVDDSADARLVAADLLAQAEHADGIPMLVSLDEALVERVERELDLQLAALPNAAACRRALEQGFVIVEPDLKRAIHAVDEIAPAHLQLVLRDTGLARYLVRHCGTLFVGPRSSESFADYGAGPNCMLPTARGARSRGGLSVFTFLRVRPWLEITDPTELAADAAAFARLEGFEAHARAAEIRAKS